jgi:hypothetical protein
MVSTLPRKCILRRPDLWTAPAHARRVSDNYHIVMRRVGATGSTVDTNCPFSALRF